MEIANYQSGDEHEILKLFKLAFGKDMSLPYWKWRFENNPCGKHLIKLMWEGKQLVGHYAVSPVNLVRNQNEIKSALSMTTMTHPDYGGRGVFGQLANALYETLSKEHNINLVWGFPNNNSHYSFIKKLEWKDVGVMHELALEKTFGLKEDIDSVKITDSIIGLDPNMVTPLSDFFSVKKSKDYLVWRFDQNPSQQYKVASLYNQDEEQVAAIVFKSYVSNVAEILNIMDFFGELSPSNLVKLVQKAFTTNPDAKRITAWFSLWRKEYQNLEKIGFKPSGATTYVGVRYHNKPIDGLTYLNNWNLNFSDSDVY